MNFDRLPAEESRNVETVSYPDIVVHDEVAVTTIVLYTNIWRRNIAMLCNMSDSGFVQPFTAAVVI